MEIKDLTGRRVKLATGSITAKNDDDKTIGIVRNVRRLKDAAPREVFSFAKLAQGLWGTDEYSRLYIDGKSLVYLYDLRRDENFNRYFASDPVMFSEDHKRHEERRKNKEAAQAAGCVVIDCYII